jgi:hypothetical protein
MIDLKPPKIIAIYLPAFFAVVASLLLVVAGCCSWPQILAIKIAAALIAFAVSWILLVAAYCGYHLFRALLRRLFGESTRTI